ncbi:MAG: hypothetical protein IPJ19_16835 [Planctomycetes bacterium]|nr:hypothetical protein [Planctomycetota bacterium]
MKRLVRFALVAGLATSERPFMNLKCFTVAVLAVFPCACSGLQPDSNQPAAQAKAEPKPEPQPEAQPMAALQIRPAPAQPEQPVAAAPDSREERLAALQKEQREAMNAYYAAIDAALGDNKNPTAEEWKKITETVKEPDATGYAARAQALVDEDATDLTAFKTLQWQMDNARDPAQSDAAMALLEKHHMDRPEMGDMCDRLARGKGGELLEKLITSSPHPEVRGRACLAQAEGLKSDIETADYIKGKSAEELGGMAEYLGADKLESLKTLDAEATQKRIESIYERVASEFGDVKLYAGTKRETTLGSRAGAALFEIRNLAVGKPAPEIEAVDLDSVAFKLSDYRGKVVLLDFWGNW